MIDLAPDSPLAERINRAIATVDNAQEQLHILRMLDVARIAREAVPTAEAVIVDDSDYGVDPDGLRLHAILDDSDKPLWTRRSALPITSTSFAESSDGTDWEYVVVSIEYVLSRSLGAAPPRSWWQPEGEPAEENLYRAELPSRDAVAEALDEQTTPPDRNSDSATGAPNARGPLACGQPLLPRRCIADFSKGPDSIIDPCLAATAWHASASKLDVNDLRLAALSDEAERTGNFAPYDEHRGYEVYDALRETVAAAESLLACYGHRVPSPE
ncbi:hypothetical protein ABZ863_12765 [Saccharomonospora sp. NPDC046836]|uniref:hypothetical protein n=1 Tax=Saccharomonospora sp. NPDC046836 TaxID=3156921 RepID=UPI0033EE4528